MNQIKSQAIVVSNKLGLHARACSKLVSLANQFDCEISLSKNTSNGPRIVNAKSIMAVMMLAANCGTPLILTVSGAEVDILDNALKEITALFNNKFGEAE